MSGYNLIREIRQLEQDCDSLGLMMCHSRHGHYTHEFGDVVAVKPKDSHSLPIYSRDAEMFVGSLSDLKNWIMGIQWARKYDQLLKVSDDRRRTKMEDQYRHSVLLAKLKKEHANNES